MSQRKFIPGHPLIRTACLVPREGGLALSLSVAVAEEETAAARYECNRKQEEVHTLESQLRSVHEDLQSITSQLKDGELKEQGRIAVVKHLFDDSIAKLQIGSLEEEIASLQAKDTTR